MGLDGLVGRTTVNVEGEAVEFPADLGGQCAAWDDGYHPRCENGETGPWCGESWCYVDPCNCDLPASPTLSEYLPEGEHQGKPVHFSYATCDSVDTWTKGHASRMRVDVAAVCSKQQDEQVWGKKGCRCVGIGERPGAAEVEFGKDLVAYPAGLGAKCEAWDHGVHPDCRGPGAHPEWCSQKWCYVDPCSCDLAASAEECTYLNGTTHQGRPLHFSYAACGQVVQANASAATPAEKTCSGLGETSCQGVHGAARCKWDHARGRCSAWGLPALCEAADGAGSGASPRAGLGLVLQALLTAAAALLTAAA